MWVVDLTQMTTMHTDFVRIHHHLLHGHWLRETVKRSMTLQLDLLLAYLPPYLQLLQ
jgi:hypothetical protein